MKKSLIALGMTGTMILAGTSMAMAEDKPYDGTNLVFWMQAYGSDPSIQRAALDKVTADFQEQTGISVEYNIVDWGSVHHRSGHLPAQVVKHRMWQIFSLPSHWQP